MTDEITVTAPRMPSAGGMALIQHFEGCKLCAYPDPGTGGDPWTIGWGATGADIKRGLVWTQQQADDRFFEHIRKFAGQVERATQGHPTNQHQFDAMVSFHYNTGQLLSSTLLRKHNAGDFAGAQREFARWDHAAGKTMHGLTVRRLAEAGMYGSKA